MIFDQLLGPSDTLVKKRMGALLLARMSLLYREFSLDHTMIQNCIVKLIELYTAWHTAEPNYGYVIKTEEWQRRLGDTD